MPNLNLQSKLIGREKELKQLQAYLDQASKGHGNTVFISEEGGIGKTQLVYELKEIAKSHNSDSNSSIWCILMSSWSPNDTQISCLK